ncbi:MAG: O-acetyl-ADP-ribose deacetylase [Chitinophagales bacterium]
MIRVELRRGDITIMKVDAIVNAANSSLMGGGGVDGAIHQAGGEKILQECMEYVSKHGRLSTGEAMITSGGYLPAKFVIHTVGPVWNGGRNHEEELLANAYRNSLKLATERKLKTIAFPNISTGVYHFPKEKAAEIAVKTVKDFLSENSEIAKVYFICFDDENFGIYQPLLSA